MSVITIKKTGKSHLIRKKSCQDAYSLSDDNKVAVVCDGASSASMAEVGARVLSNEMCEFLNNDNTKTLLKNLSNSEIRQLVYNEICSITGRLCNKYCKTNNDFACTFLAMVLLDDDTGYIFHTGDGVIAALSESSSFVSILSWPDNPYLDSRIYAADNPVYAKRMHVLKISTDCFSRIMLCTDGFAKAFSDDEGWFIKENFLKLICVADSYELEKLESMHASVDDDITAVIFNLSDDGIKSSQTGEPHCENHVYDTSEATAADFCPPRRTGYGVKSKKQKTPKWIVLAVWFCILSVVWFDFKHTKKIDIAYKIEIQHQEKIEKLTRQIQALNSEISNLKSKMEDLVAHPAYPDEKQRDDTVNSDSEKNSDLQLPEEPRQFIDNQSPDY